MKKLLALALTLTLAASVFAAEYPEITIKELKPLIGSPKVTLIDVNGSESFNSGHIPGAIDYQASQDKLASLLPKDKNALIVAYCGNPRCKAYLQGATKAEKLGYKNVKHLTAGIAGWKDAGEKTEAAK